jgi:hypothetical protein
VTTTVLQRVGIPIAVLAVIACGGASRSASPDTNDAVVMIDCPVGDAVVWVNGRYIRQVRELRGGMALSPGHHFVEVKHDGYHTFYAELDLRARERRTLVVRLAEMLD